MNENMNQDINQNIYQNPYINSNYNYNANDTSYWQNVYANNVPKKFNPVNLVWMIPLAIVIVIGVGLFGEIAKEFVGILLDEVDNGMTSGRYEIVYALEQYEHDFGGHSINQVYSYIEDAKAAEDGFVDMRNASQSDINNLMRYNSESVGQKMIIEGEIIEVLNDHSVIISDLNVNYNFFTEQTSYDILTLNVDVSLLPSDSVYVADRVTFYTVYAGKMSTIDGMDVASIVAVDASIW